VHITDNNATTILSTNPESTALSSLMNSLVTTSGVVEHLGLGQIHSVHTKYVDGEVVQFVQDGTTGILATLAGKEVQRSIIIEKIVEAIHNALEDNEESQESGRGREEETVEEERMKDMERRERCETLE
jgi:hypothetical protein